MAKKLTFEQFIRSVKQNKGVAHSMLLGAGASIESGIPSAYDCIWIWKRDIFTSHNPHFVDKYSNPKNEVTQQVIQKWLDRHGGYPEKDHESEYSFYAEEALPIPGDRRRFFQNLFSGKKGSIGYELICILSEYGMINSVWTTNFDGLTARTASNYNLTTIEVTLESQDRIYRNKANNELIYIALHGDYKYGDTKNIQSELDAQDEVLISALSHELNDTNLIVMGYSGRDDSLMNALKSAYSKKGAGRLYWCGYGHTIPEKVQELIAIAQDNGREAFFVPTDGFDQTMLKMALSSFDDDKEVLSKVHELMRKSEIKLNETTSFKTYENKVNKVIKSNLIPFVLPKKMYQIDIDTSDGVKEWDICRGLRSKRIIAIPFKGKLYSFSNIGFLREDLKDRIRGVIEVVDVDLYKFKNYSVFKELAVASAVEALSRKEGYEFDGRSKIWIEDRIFRKQINNRNIIGFKGVKVSVVSDLQNIYLSFLPTCFVEDYETYDQLTKANFYKQFDAFVCNKKPNYGFELYIKGWIDALIGPRHLKVNFSNDNEDFIFKFGHNSLFVGLKSYNGHGYKLPSFVKENQIAIRGEELKDPELQFYNPQAKKYQYDFHPMRGLTVNQPFDYSSGAELQKQEINIGVLCPKGHEKKLSDFLNGLNSTHSAQVNTDYLISYPGYTNIYGISLNIPEKGSSGWVEYQATSREDNRKACYELGANLNTGLNTLHNNGNIDVIVIYIPKDFDSFTNYKDDNGKFDLHDYVKAYAVQNNISTQFLREDTMDSKLDCQIAWSLSLAFYVKSLRTPWILAEQENDVAYAGIGYSFSHGNNSNYVVGCSHIYSSDGQGMKYKLSRLTDFTLDNKNNPFLTENEAYKLGISIKELFFKSFSELPRRVVVHKRTEFRKEEIVGLKNSLLGNGIEQLDLIEITHEENARFFELKGEEIDGFPVRRGTCFPITHNTALLYTHGIAPSVKNPSYRYIQGGKSLPVPLKIVKHYGQGDLQLIGKEILGLSKMNWNSFELYSKLPCTIESANVISRIGQYLEYYDGKVYDYRNFM